MILVLHGYITANGGWKTGAKKGLEQLCNKLSIYGYSKMHRRECIEEEWLRSKHDFIQKNPETKNREKGFHCSGRLKECESHKLKNNSRNKKGRDT